MRLEAGTQSTTESPRAPVQMDAPRMTARANSHRGEGRRGGRLRLEGALSAAGLEESAENRGSQVTRPGPSAKRYCN